MNFAFMNFKSVKVQLHELCVLPNASKKCEIIKI